MSDALTATIRGHLLPVQDARRLVEAAFTLELQAGGAIMRTALATASPVKTGALRADWKGADARPVWEGSVYALAIYNERIYAPVVQVRGRSAGYADTGFQAGKDAALAAIKAGDVAPLLWVDA